MAEEKMKSKQEKPKEKKTEQKTKEPKEKEQKKEENPKAPNNREAEKKEKQETKESKKEAKKPKEQPKKDKAVVRAFNLRISKKYSKFVCRAIAGKETQKAMEILEKVMQKKFPIKMPNLEIAHQKGKGVAGAKYPVKAAKEIKDLVKQLEANAHVNGIENPVIKIAKADKGETVYRRGFRRAKRTNIYLEAVEKP